MIEAQLWGEVMPDAPYRMTTPTLMIGLGGLGSSIVQEVFDGLDDDVKQYARAHVLDTDARDLQDDRFERLRDSRCQTQTSRAVTVHDCVRDLGLEHQVARWFPTTSASSLMHKQLTAGAGQVRAISRLSWVDTLSGLRIDDLNTNLNRLFEAKSSSIEESARVLIVNSLAGGTGSGLFLQMALYVREFFQQRGVTAVTVRGFTVMPDVFIFNGDYGSLDLRDNVRANAYAALKEIDALVRLRAGAYSDPSTTLMAPLYEIALEYMPGRKIPVAVGAGKQPFDVVTLFDYANNQGRNIGSKRNCILQVTDAIKLHLFSPLEGKGGPDSQEDNLANTHLASGDRSRYAGCGTANLVYPFSDLADYAALRWATDGISSSWSEIDRLITEEIQEVERARREGNPIEMPDRHTRFADLIVDKGAGAKKSGLFRMAYLDTRLRDEKGNDIANKHDEWIQALERRVKELTAAAIDEKRSELSQISTEALRDAERVVHQVEQNEQGLESFAKQVDKRVQPIGTMLAKDSVWAPFDRGADTIAGEATQLNTWLLAKDRPMHPLAMRFFLCRARAVLRSRLDQYRHELKMVSDAVDGYGLSWDDPSTEAPEYATDQARASTRFLSRLTGGLGRFADDYLARSEAQRANIELRAELFVLAEMCELLLAYVEALVEAFTRWFLSLSDISREARARIEALESLHDQSGDPTCLYVFASAAIKRKMWEERSGQLVAAEFPPDIARQLYSAVYRDVGKTLRQGLPEDRAAEWGKALFEDAVVRWCRGQVAKLPSFDIDVATAIRVERECLQRLGDPRAGASDEDAFRSYLRQLEALATPWIDSGGKGQRFDYLCLHPSAEHGWGEAFLDQVARRRTVHAGFSRYRISRMVVQPALRATDLRPMVGTHATYRAAYEDRIRKSRARPPAAVTPHLDYHWDSPAFLPELDDGEQARAIADIYRAAIFVLADQAAGVPARVFSKTIDLRPVWAWSPSRGVEDALHDKDGHIVPANTCRLIDALGVNYWLVLEIVAAAAEREAALRSDPGSATFMAQLALLVDAIHKVPSQAADASSGAKRQVAMLQALFDEVYGVHLRATGGPETAKAATRAALGGLWQASSELRARPDSEFAGLVRRCVDYTLNPQA